MNKIQDKPASSRESSDSYRTDSADVSPSQKDDSVRSAVKGKTSLVTAQELSPTKENKRIIPEIPQSTIIRDSKKQEPILKKDIEKSVKVSAIAFYELKGIILKVLSTVMASKTLYAVS